MRSGLLTRSYTVDSVKLTFRRFFSIVEHMLSLPENWDYSEKGLSFICKDGLRSISTAVKELESSGYIQRRRVRDAHGRLSDVEYIIMEKPVSAASNPAAPKCQNPILDNPIVENPDMENPRLEKSSPLSKEEFSKDHKNKDQFNTHSFFPAGAPAEGQKDALDEREKIKHQIEYDWLWEQFRAEPIDELVEIMLEVAMNRSPTIRIGRDAEYPTSYVQDRFSRITSMHIERVCDGIRDNHTQVRNTKAYLLAALFNAVSTLDSYYTMQANSDFGGSF